MLKLKRVEIHGFKSFYDRTEMRFSGSGIAAVVGPNGCGKSNLSDALSWVLGEQSAKSLRGVRMEDVIFAGTRDKKALGMASVTMTLIPDERVFVSVKAAGSDNPLDAVETADGASDPDQPQPDEPQAAQEHSAATLEPARIATVQPGTRGGGEITITRRLYRSGDSEYLINGKQARLRDIQDLFLGTGLGPESYAIIEQGRIGQILSNKPQDRRNVIEEAAGITKFKTRKRLAEAKLESAKGNLARVFDILEEVTRQANSLKRQAAKTKRYGELKDEATGYLRQLLTERFRLLERDAAQIVIELNLATAEWQKAQAAIAEQEAGQEKTLADSYETEARLTEARRQLADLKLEAERARGRLEYQTKQVERIGNAEATGGRDLEMLEAQSAERTAELDAQTGQLGELERTFTVAAEELTAKADERQTAQSSLTEGERGLEAKRSAVLRLLGESAGLKNRITQVEAQLAASDRDGGRAREEEKQSQADLGRLAESRKQLSEQLSARQTALISVGEQLKIVQSELQATKGQLSESHGLLDRLKNEASRLRARKDSLSEIIQHRSYTTETVKRLFTAVERGKTESFQPLGVLADFVEVDPQYEKAAEEFLHDELEYVVVHDWSEGERGIELMRGDLDGRGTFLVEHTASQAGEPADVPRPEVSEGALTRLADALHWTNGLSQVPIAQLPRIANCYLASERALARELATQFPHCWFLTSDGVHYHGQAVSGGKKSGAGPLALKRELKDLVRAEQAKLAELKTAGDRQLELERMLTALSEELDQLRGQQQNQEKDVLALDHESRKLAEESGRAQARLSHARLELDRIARDRIKLEEGVAADRSALERSEGLRASEEEALAEAREQLADLRDSVARLSEEHASRRAELAAVDERRRSVEAARGRLETQLRDLVNRRAHLDSEMERMAGERAHLLANNSELNARSGELQVAIGEAEEQAGQLAAREADLRSALAAVEEDLRERRGAAQRQQETRAERQVSLARAESERKHLEETCAAELNRTLPELAAEAGEEPPVLPLVELEARHSEARRKIENLGPVNPTALEEFEEAQQRQEFLTVQRQDLLDSIRDTERAIGEIDSESRKRFGEAFHAINENFRAMFQTLFGGGTGEMRLTDEDNLADSGIDIVASPPGKRLQSVLLLSGGEKSLTAMALLMAIFQYTPSPFCILDEVDAPLDEPNIERLTHLLQNMSEDTQFIVITHAKRTMEAAQALYGVTMQEPGVSKLVSVKFKNPREDEPLRPRRESRLAAAGV